MLKVWQLQIIFACLAVALGAAARPTSDLNPVPLSPQCDRPVGQAPRGSKTPIDPRDAEMYSGLFWVDRDQILSNLPQVGVDRIGDWKLDEFRRDLQSLKVSVEPWLCVQTATAGDQELHSYRNSAEWWRNSPRDRGVMINARLWPLIDLEVLPVLALHESLGAEGIDDDLYSCSVGLWFLAHPKGYQSIFRKEEIAAVKDFTRKLCLRKVKMTHSQPAADTFPGLAPLPDGLRRGGPTDAPVIGTGPGQIDPAALGKLVLPQSLRQTFGRGTSTGVGGGGDERAIELKMFNVVLWLSNMRQLTILQNQKPPPENLISRAEVLHKFAMNLDGSVDFGGEDYLAGSEDHPMYLPVGHPVCKLLNQVFCEILPVTQVPSLPDGKVNGKN